MGLLTLLPRSIKGLKMISLVIFTVTLVVLTRETTLIQNKVRTVPSTSPGLRSSGKSVQAVRKRVFLCGYRLTQFVDAVFPDYEVIDEYDPAKGSIVSDILAIGMHSDCAFAKNFNGVVFYLNGESTTTDVADDSYYLGPVSSPRPNAMQLYYASFASLVIPSATQMFHERPKGSGENFLLYVSSRCLGHREAAFKLFSAIGEVTAAGKCHGDEYKVDFKRAHRFSPSWGLGAPLYGKYKFGLVMENVRRKGYITEKIVTAFAGGTIPIYFGTEEIMTVFNPKAFIYYNESDTQSVIDQVKYLMKNLTAYDEMLSEPVCTLDQFGRYFSLTGNGQLKRNIREFLQIGPIGTSSFMESESDYRTGMFSQMFQFLTTYIKDVDKYSNSSSARWRVNGYAPQEGSHFHAIHFERLYRPVRHIEDELMKLEISGSNYYRRIRARAQQIFRLAHHMSAAVESYKQILHVNTRSTTCLHVRRGDKAEGIRKLNNAEIIAAVRSMRPNNGSDSSLYLLTDDLSVKPILSDVVEGSVMSFPEEQCAMESGLTEAECFIVSVFLAIDVCKTFIGSSTSNLSRFIMLLGGEFYDLDGVVDHVSATQVGKWYFPHDHCIVADGILPSGEACGYISPRCEHCQRHDCSQLVHNCVN